MSQQGFNRLYAGSAFDESTEQPKTISRGIYDAGNVYEATENFWPQEPPVAIEPQVGRQMDYDVATKVLKLSVGHELTYNTGSEKFFTDALPYSTDIFSAMQILAVLQNKGFMWSVNGSSEGGHWCVLYPSFGGFVETELCDTPEEAICRAALMLVPLMAG